RRGRSCARVENSFTFSRAPGTRSSSVILLTAGRKAPAHDYAAPRLRRIEALGSRPLGEGVEGHVARGACSLAMELAVDDCTGLAVDPSRVRTTAERELPMLSSLSTSRARIARALTRAALPCAALLAAACGSGGDGSVGVGSGQDPDPVALDFPIFYTKGPLFDENMQLQSSADVRDVERFNVGTDLYMRDRASPTAVERNITIRETGGLGDVMGVEISPDGRKVVFAMRGPFDPNLDDEDQPTWNIWEYEIA